MLIESGVGPWGLGPWELKGLGFDVISSDLNPKLIFGSGINKGTGWKLDLPVRTLHVSSPQAEASDQNRGASISLRLVTWTLCRRHGQRIVREFELQVW